MTLGNRYGKVWKICDCWPGKLRCSLHWWLFQHLLLFLHFIKSLMERFVKSALLKYVTSVARPTTIDISKVDCFVDYSKVDIGFTTENAVKAVKKNVSDKQLLDFRLSCRNFLKAVVARLLNKTAVQYPLAILHSWILDLYPTQTRTRHVWSLYCACYSAV